MTEKVEFSFERLIAWQKGIVFVDQVFDVADSLPQRYQFSLGEQLRRAALSITNNLAEGSGRGTPAQQRYLYDVAKGSAFEVVSILSVIKTRERIAPDTHATLRKQAKEIISIIFGLIKATYQKEGKSFREDPGIYDTST